MLVPLVPRSNIVSTVETILGMIGGDGAAGVLVVSSNASTRNDIYRYIWSGDIVEAEIRQQEAQAG